MKRLLKLLGVRSETHNETGNGRRHMLIMAWPKTGRNPYNGILYAALECRGAEVVPLPSNLLKALLWKADVFHFHWINALFHHGVAASVFRSAAFLAFVIGLRLKKVTTVWTLHNTGRFTHAQRCPRLERLVVRALFRLVDGFIVHSRFQLDELAAEVRDRTQYIPHHNYESILVQSAAENRTNAGHLIYFGTLAPYKGVEQAIEAFQSLPTELKKNGFVICGSPKREVGPGYADTLRSIIEQNSVGITFDPSYVPDDILEERVKKAAGTILPYISVVNSGAIAYALSNKAPVIAPQNHLTQELLESFPGLGSVLLTYGDGADLEDRMRALLRRKQHTSTGPYDAYLVATSSNRAAEMTLSFFRSLRSWKNAV